MKNEAVTSAANSILKKFTSRKFVMALIGVITGIAGMIGFQDEIVGVIGFIALEVVSILAYAIIEGKNDGKSIEAAMKVGQEITQIVSDIKKDGKISDETANMIASGGINVQVVDKMSE